MSHEELKVEFRHVSDVIHYLCSLYRLSSDIDAPEVSSSSLLLSSLEVSDTHVYEP